jgi:diaminopimelate decarboxylase
VAEAAADGEQAVFEVVGPICETGDTFGTPRALPVTGPGDLLAIRTAGAYGAVMASFYNTRPLVPEVLVNADGFSVIRDRVTVDDMLSREQLPDWLGDDAALRREAGE